jgi:cation diffusion facilitator CzcD-associated flavoprotein CzcO
MIRTASQSLDADLVFDGF